jgi:hypothetical protein
VDALPWGLSCISPSLPAADFTLLLVWSNNVHFGRRRGAEMHVIPPDAEAALVARARRQHGVVTFAQLRTAGLGPHAIEGRVERGWLRRVHRGVYVVGALESELTAPTAALAAYGHNAVISHRTAAVLWRLLPARPDDPVDITLLNANRRSRPGVTVHRAKRSIVRRRHGLRLTSPAQTLTDLDPADLDEAYNEALVLNLVTHQEVRALVHRSPALRAILEEVPGMTRSKMERALRALVKQAGLPAPRSNASSSTATRSTCTGRTPAWSSNSTAGTHIRAAPHSSRTDSKTPRSSSRESALCASPAVSSSGGANCSWPAS